MTNYKRGREAEYKAVRVLEEAGYMAQRSAGSHSVWDVCAVGPSGVRLIQVKRCKKGASWKWEFGVACEQMEGLPELPGVTREVWVYEDYRGFIKREVV